MWCYRPFGPGARHGTGAWVDPSNANRPRFNKGGGSRSTDHDGVLAFLPAWKNLLKIVDEPFPQIGDEHERKVREYGLRLPPECCRFILPLALVKALAEHPLSRDLFLASAGFYPGDLRCYDCPPQPYNVIYYCVGGAVTLRIGSTNWEASSGDLLVLPPGQAHTTEASRTTPWTYYWIAFAGEGRHDYTQFLDISRPVTPLGIHPELIAELEALCALRSSDFTLDTFVVAANRLKALLTRTSLIRSRGAMERKGRIDLNRVRHLMASRMDGSLNLDELARASNLSTYHYTRSFKQLSGLSPVQYYIQLRIQQACHLLTTSSEPIARVASAVGYDDPRYFSRTFRRVVGMTPLAYRRWGSQMA